MKFRLPSALEYVIYAIAYWIPFTARTAVLGIASCIGGPFTKGDFSRKCMKRWCIDSLRQLKIKVTGQGIATVRPAGAGVIVSNHVSSLDILALGAVLDVDYKWAAKRILFLVPFLGWHLRFAGHIPVNRKKSGAMHKLRRDFQRTLESGHWLLIFPEGTRAPDSTLMPFRLGAFVTAIENQVPIVPVVIHGTRTLMRKNAWSLDQSVRRDVTVRVLPTIKPPDASNLRREDLRSAAATLRDRTHAAMAAALAELEGKRAAATTEPVQLSA